MGQTSSASGWKPTDETWVGAKLAEHLLPSVPPLDEFQRPADRNRQSTTIITLKDMSFID